MRFFMLAAVALAFSPRAYADTPSDALVHSYMRSVEASASRAIPSFSRQTGLACNVCHTTFPQLTAFGRQFKLDGYTMATLQRITESDSNRTQLSIGLVPPLSAMVISSYTRTQSAIPGTQNGNPDFPQEMSLFLGGAITPHLGGFFQLTYEPGEGRIAVDNIDIRLSNRALVGTREMSYGLTLNNNPTVQDMFNTAPAWGYPYTASAFAPGSLAGTVLDGALGQSVAGLGAYAGFAGGLYGEFTAYRSAPQDAANPPDGSSEGTLHGIAPYWRLALQHSFGNNEVEIGTYGLIASLYPAGVTGPTDRFTDAAVDAQLTAPVGRGTFAAHGIWIHENQKLDATFAGGGSDAATNKLNTLRLDATYITSSRVGFTAGFLNTNGTTDAGLYGAAPFEGSAVGSPNSTGLMGELSWMPWLNMRLGIQYTLWTKFNGLTTNYDGSGRSAKDNNTLYLYSWIAL